MNQKGFTLLEVMMALAILAIVGISVTRTVGANVSNTLYMRQKTIARWVADNELTTIRLEHQWPKESWESYTVDMANNEWHIRKRSVKTTNDNFRMVQVEVRNQKDDKAPALETLQTYMVRQ
ncbi:type II secretion system minor pseudopilin GspI [Endozoicomonas euniceicola]|uniref:Type II secretion system protein I n=1 Tax=Endozoicomonas euniceicola TaxID=1234143 RepID=A0ABY6GND8_9GAMM|nr:type II secretion system minor pseudopilin GspI [Endozoicomonas euniceicola]UYM14160.1 type II secretion system minor pseudopilin GspI [Endozoicomonas euniceicola]